MRDRPLEVRWLGRSDFCTAPGETDRPRQSQASRPDCARRTLVTRARASLHHRPKFGSIEPARVKAFAVSAFRDQSRRAGDLSWAGTIGRLLPPRSQTLRTGFASLPPLDRGAAHRVARA